MAGRAGSRIWKTSLHQNHSFFLGLGAGSGLTAPLRAKLWIPKRAVAHLGVAGPEEGGQTGPGLHGNTMLLMSWQRKGHCGSCHRTATGFKFQSSLDLATGEVQLAPRLSRLSGGSCL